MSELLGKNYDEDITKLYQLVINQVLKKKYKWFDHIIVNQLSFSKSQDYMGIEAELFADEDWVGEQWREFYYSKPMPSGTEDDPIVLGELIGTEISKQLQDDFKTVFMFVTSEKKPKYMSHSWIEVKPIEMNGNKLTENISRIKQMMGILKEQSLPNCGEDITPHLEPAIKYWKDWLNNPITKEKFMKNNKIDESKLNEIYKKYMYALDNLKFIYFDNTPKFSDPNVTEPEVIEYAKDPEAYAFVFQRKYPNTIFYNCGATSKDKTDVLIHEIAHILDEVFFRNPYQQIYKIFSDKMRPPKNFKEDNLISVIKNLGVTDQNKMNEIVEKYKFYNSESQIKNQYACDLWEKSANTQILKKLFNKEPGQQIQISDLKKYILLEEELYGDIKWLIFCWASRGFDDIESMVNKINDLAKVNITNSTKV